MSECRLMTMPNALMVDSVNCYYSLLHACTGRSYAGLYSNAEGAGMIKHVTHNDSITQN